VFLTPSGQAMAERSRQRHRLVVDLLLAIGAPREAAEADAEGVEHYVSQATLDAFAAFLKTRG
jgi:DtxR family manganese transport transcriptional regulator